MQPDITQTILAWAAALFLYPGLLFAVALALAAEWLFALLWPLVTTRTYRQRATRPALLYPLFSALHLSGRRSPARWSPEPASGPTTIIANPTNSNPITSNALALAGTITSIIALALLPLPGSPLNRPGGPDMDLLTILVLLAAGPLCKAASRLLTGGQTSLRGAQDLGRLITGLIPTFLAIAALVEVSTTHTLQIAAVTAAPETAPQTIVRLLSGAVLLVTLHWWLDLQNTPAQIAQLLQTVAMSALWSILIIPVVGDRYWAIALTILGTLFAYLAMRAIPYLWLPVRRQRDAANLVWVTALPLAAMALLISLWTAS